MFYCAIIGDIVGSKKLKTREEIQFKFDKVLKKINTKYSDDIASKFMITLGDEFQGLLKNFHVSYKIIKEIQKNMDPVKLVFGVGIGPMDTEFKRYNSIGSDGPAYHLARYMVQKSKIKKPSICYKIYNSLAGDLINSSIYFIESCQNKRTKKQKVAVELYENKKSQMKVAKSLNIGQSAVSQLLKNSFYDEIKNAEDNIEVFLMNISKMNQSI